MMQYTVLLLGMEEDIVGLIMWWMILYMVDNNIVEYSGGYCYFLICVW